MKKEERSRITIDVCPMGAPRMTRSDKWKTRTVVQKYWAYRDDVRKFCEKKGYVQGEFLDVVFVLPMPKSWSKKKRESFLGKKHQAKPDTDNLVKAWLDAHLEEDSHVWDIKALKVWGEEGQVLLGQYNEIKQHLVES